MSELEHFKAQNQVGSRTIVTLERQIVDFLVSDNTETGELASVRLKFARPALPQGVSKNQTIRAVQWYRGDTKTPIGASIVIFEELRRERWATVECVDPTEVLRRCGIRSGSVQQVISNLARGKNVFLQVRIGCGEVIASNVDEVFWFAYLPAEVAAFKDEGERRICLGNLVLDLIECEEQQKLEKLKAESNARHEAELKKFPARLPHEPRDFDHYKNRADVLWQLLCKDWPQFFAAHDRLEQAKTESERANCQKRVWLAYIADHKAIYGNFPEVKEDEAAELWHNDDYNRLMSDVLNAPRSHDKRSWQLANGWIEKNYYRMNEVELEEAFVRDWSYPPGLHKGNTLAKHARKIGLCFALRPGRPEKSNLLPPG